MTLRRYVVVHRRALAAAWFLAVLVTAGFLGAVLVVAPTDSDPFTGSGRQLSLAGAGVDLKVDADSDGLADVDENFLYGSDPGRWSTTDNGIPDGWFARYGFDPSRPAVETTEAAVPPAARLPAAFRGEWPEEFRWTLAQVYAFGRPSTWNESNDGIWENGVDPREWSTGEDGLPTAWAAHYGIDPRESGLAHRSSFGDDFTVLEDFQSGTDPTKADTDGDGLTDADEVRRHHTDPRNPSTSGSGIPDGWLIRFGYDPRDVRVGTLDPTRKGLTLIETYEYNRARHGEDHALLGKGLDPTKQSTVGGLIPDGWLVRQGIDPLDPKAPQKVVQKASEFQNVRHLEAGPDGKKPLPDLILRIQDAYEYNRLAQWSQAEQGPWLGGLDPRRLDQDLDGLPDAIELRGWYIKRSVGVGADSLVQTIHVRSNPLLNDTDGDGFNDSEEYFGLAERGGLKFRWSPTDPSSSDSAFSGLKDTEKVLGSRVDGSDVRLTRTNGSFHEPLLEPTVRDSDADHMPDGEELRLWVAESHAVGTPYALRYPGSRHKSYESWLSEFRKVPVSAAQAAQLLGPQGDLDEDGKVNLVDPDADGDGLLDGFEVRQGTTGAVEGPEFSPRSPTDPGNPDTDGDGLPDGWEARFARFDVARGWWDLDPSKWSSDGSGRSDAQANLDGDIQAWNRYEGASPDDRVAHPGQPFDFANLLEHEFRTNPRVADENDDGVMEGWAVFWGKVYPDYARKGKAGAVAPGDAELSEVEPKLANPLSPVGTIAKASQDYVRFVEVVGEANPLLDLQRSETFDAHWPQPVEVIRGEDVRTLVLGKIKGKYDHTFARDASLGLNPYLLDTDGDLLPDAWESLFGPCPASSSGTSDPQVPDGRQDPDDDEVVNADEFRLGTNPCLADSDLGGWSDGIESLVGLDPLSPHDDAAARGGEDTDRDRVKDQAELARRTNPTLPDTDLDGLLDGPSMQLTVGFADHDTLIGQLQAYGIAHRVSSDGRAYTFLGEDAFGSNPRDPDTSGDGIPDGWLAYHGKDPALRGGYPDFLSGYRCARPEWWDESLLGTWWWGVNSPVASACSPDLDSDGLNDLNGEDPVPGADRRNHPERLLPDEIPELLTKADRLRAGQGWGDCAGNPNRCRAEWGALGPGVRASVQFADINFGLSDETFLVEKGQPFVVTGRLIIGCGDDCTPMPAPSRTILLRFGSAALATNVLGVGFTDPDGAFRIDACFCLGGKIAIPQTGIVAQGRTAGQVFWSFSANRVEPGEQKPLVLEALATTATFWNDAARNPSHPQFISVALPSGVAHATAGVTHASAPRHVSTATRLEFENLPTFIPWTTSVRSLNVTAKLVDALGGPLSGQAIQLKIGNEPALSATTDEGGRAEFGYAIPASHSAPLPVTVLYAGTPPFRFAAPPNSSVVALQDPLQLQVIVSRLTARVGEPLTFLVVPTSRGNPVPHLPLRASLGPLAVTGQSNATGAAQFTFPPIAFEPSSLTLRVQADATSQYAAALETIDLQILTGSKLEFTAPDMAPIGATFPVEGRLLQTNNQPIPDARLTIGLGTQLIGQFTTDVNGRFSGALMVPGNATPGDHELVAYFAGVPDRIDAAEAHWSLKVVVGTRLAIPDITAAPNTTVNIAGRLQDLEGRPLIGERVVVKVGTLLVGRPLTNAEGSFTALFKIPPLAKPGRTAFLVDYGGSTNGTFGPASAVGHILVGLPTRLVASFPSVVERGNLSLGGRLETTQGEGVADALVHLTGPAGVGATGATGPDGRFRIIVRLGPEVIPGPLAVEVAFKGNETLAPTSMSGELTLRVQPRLAVVVAPEVGRGTSVSLRVSLLDDLNRPLAGRRILIEAFGGVARGATDDTGWLNESLAVPKELPLGPTTVRFRFEEESGYAPATAERQVFVKEGVRLFIDGLPSEATAQQRLDIQLRVEDLQGNPVAHRLVGVRLSTDRVAVVAETNESGVAKLPMATPSEGAFHVIATFEGSERLASASMTSDLVPIRPASISDSSVQPWLLASAVASCTLTGLVAFAFLRARRVGRARVILQGAERQIIAGGPWAAAVILAYQRLVALVKPYGFKARRGETVREYVRALARRVALPRASAAELVELVERAMYEGGAMNPEDSRRARQALHRIIQALETNLRPTPEPPSKPRSVGT